MNEDEYNQRIETLSNKIIQDQTPIDEQDPQKLQKYYDYVKTNYQLEGEPATQLVNEAFLYLKLKESKDADPIKDGTNLGRVLASQTKIHNPCNMFHVGSYRYLDSSKVNICIVLIS